MARAPGSPVAAGTTRERLWCIAAPPLRSALEVLAKDIGTSWAKSGATAVLSAPSVVVPNERNYLLNPAHPDFSKIRFSAPKPFVFDKRLE